MERDMKEDLVRLVREDMESVRSGVGAQIHPVKRPVIL